MVIYLDDGKDTSYLIHIERINPGTEEANKMNKTDSAYFAIIAMGICIVSIMVVVTLHLCPDTPFTFDRMAIERLMHM